MRFRFHILCFAFLLLVSHSVAQDTVQYGCWNDGTACINRPKRLELDLFQLSSYGISDRVTIYVHPLMVWLLPQIKVKVNWGTKGSFIFTTEHELIYPTFFLSVVSRKGTGGLISPEFHFPQMLSLDNALLVSFSPFRNSLLTARAGIIFAVRFGTIDPSSTIDLPVIYPMLAPFYNSPEFNPGFDFRGKFFSLLGWQFNAECFILTIKENNFFFQNKGVLVYDSKKQHLKIEAGYKLCYGEYPYGNQWHLLPVLDLAIGLKVGKKR